MKWEANTHRAAAKTARKKGDANLSRSHEAMAGRFDKGAAELKTRYDGLKARYEAKRTK